MPVSLAELKYRAASDSIACRYERALKTHTQSHSFTYDPHIPRLVRRTYGAAVDLGR